MATLAQPFWKAGNAAAVWMYRRTGGKVGGKARGGSLVLLLTVAGRRSGLPFTVPVAYVERDGDYHLAATAGGQPKEPQWIRNLRAASTAPDSHMSMRPPSRRQRGWRSVRGGDQ